jgi:hypothetical protein
MGVKCGVFFCGKNTYYVCLKSELRRTLTGQFEMVQNEVLHDLYKSPNIFKEIRERRLR